MLTRSPRAACLSLLLAIIPALAGTVACASAAPARVVAPGAGSGESEPATAPRLRAGFLIVDGVYGTELTAPHDVLEHVRHHVAGGGIEVLTISPDGEAVTTAEGLRVVPDRGFSDAPPLDILIVPSAEGSRDRDLADTELIAWVRRAAATAGHVVSLCWGSFVLAEAGLLDGRAATTFPADYDRFATRFPQVEVKVNVSFVHDGSVLTSQGGVRSFDVAMYLVDRLFGEEVARKVGDGLLLAWPPGPETQIFVRDAVSAAAQ
jgi:transcriptional regulator GlxA family with amidase domain